MKQWQQETPVNFPTQNPSKRISRKCEDIFGIKLSSERGKTILGAAAKACSLKAQPKVCFQIFENCSKCFGEVRWKVDKTNRKSFAQSPKKLRFFIFRGKCFSRKLFNSVVGGFLLFLKRPTTSRVQVCRVVVWYSTCVACQRRSNAGSGGFEYRYRPFF